MTAQQYRELMLQRIDVLTDAWIEYNPNEPDSWLAMNSAVAALVNAAEIDINEEVV